MPEKIKTILKQVNASRPSNFKGKHHTEEAKKKLSIAHLGKKQSEETKEKKRKAALGKILSEEARKNQSNAQKGENNPRFGVVVSEETRKKHSIAAKEAYQISYIYITPVGKFCSLSEAAKELKCSRHTILQRCKKKFEGYDLVTKENKYKKRRDVAYDLMEQGYSVPEISKIMNIHNSTILRWKHKREGTTPNREGIKLAEQQVLEIRYLFDLGAPTSFIRKEFNIGKTQVHRIGKRQSWSHIPEELSPIDPDWQKNYCL